MNRLIKRLLAASATLGLVVGFSMPAVSAPPSDWSQVPTETVTLFYPGQSSYQWLRSHRAVSPRCPRPRRAVPRREDP